MEMSSSDLLDPSLLDFFANVAPVELDRHIAIWLQAMCERYRKTATTRWSNPELDKMDSHLLEASEEETLRQLYHVVSNRIDCNFDTTINLLEELPLLSGPVGRLIFQQVLMGIGIEGSALRCYTDTRALAGALSYYGQHHSFVDDGWGYFSNFENDAWVKSRYAQVVNAYPGILEEPWCRAIMYQLVDADKLTAECATDNQAQVYLFLWVDEYAYEYYYKTIVDHPLSYEDWVVQFHPDLPRMVERGALQISRDNVESIKSLIRSHLKGETLMIADIDGTLFSTLAP